MKSNIIIFILSCVVFLFVLSLISFTPKNANSNTTEDTSSTLWATGKDCFRDHSVVTVCVLESQTVSVGYLRTIKNGEIISSRRVSVYDKDGKEIAMYNIPSDDCVHGDTRMDTELTMEKGEKVLKIYVPMSYDTSLDRVAPAHIIKMDDNFSIKRTQQKILREN